MFQVKNINFRLINHSIGMTVYTCYKSDVDTTSWKLHANDVTLRDTYCFCWLTKKNKQSWTVLSVPDVNNVRIFCCFDFHLVSLWRENGKQQHELRIYKSSYLNLGVIHEKGLCFKINVWYIYFSKRLLPSIVCFTLKVDLKWCGNSWSAII